MKRHAPATKYKFFILQCFSEMARRFVDHLKPECKTFDEAHRRASNMKAVTARVGISEDGKNWVFPKGLIYEPEEEFAELA